MTGEGATGNRRVGSGTVGSGLAIIGGSGLARLEGAHLEEKVHTDTPWGESSVPLQRLRFEGVPVYFIARHGTEHRVPPHRVNFRANLWALRDAGVGMVFAVNAVGGIHPACAPGRLILPHDLIDYTWGRDQSFWDGPGAMLHVDFTEPFDAGLRGLLLEAARRIGIELHPQGVYGVTQGPRLETAAEVRRMAADGCDMAGMTLMPEAVLARELGLAYVCIAMSVNWAAGRGGIDLHAEVARHLDSGMEAVCRLLAEALPYAAPAREGPAT